MLPNGVTRPQWVNYHAHVAESNLKDTTTSDQELILYDDILQACVERDMMKQTF